MSLPTRRAFLGSATAASLSLSTARASGAASSRSNPLCVFTKPFNSISFDELAERTADIGFQGIEAPIRKGGHIEPDAVPEKLPALVAALKKQNLRITVLTSDINDPTSDINQKVLQTAAENGIRHYRMKYFKYDEGKPILAQIDRWRAQLRDLAMLNKELGITAVYQNHAGRNYFGSSVWDLKRALENIDPTEVGMAYDIRHATAEAGMSWPIGFHLMRPHIQVVYVKDFIWGDTKPVNVPLGKGRISQEFFRLLEASEFTGPISLHEEYLDHRDPKLVPRHWTAVEQDLATLQGWL